jgi:thiol-disulfide isomerase/thioredoxin
MPIKVITSKDFSKLEAKIKSKNTILLVYATWCMHCKIFKPKWEEFAKKVAGDKDIKKNDIQILEIESENLTKLAKSNPSLFNYIAKTTNSPDVYFPKIMVFKKTPTGMSKKEYRQDEGELLSYVKTKVLAVKKPQTASSKQIKAMVIPPIKDSSVRTKKSLPLLIDMMLNKYMKL